MTLYSFMGHNDKQLELDYKDYQLQQAIKKITQLEIENTELKGIDVYKEHKEVIK